MTFSKEHILLTWGGELPGGEHWACSLRTAPMPIAPGAVLILDSELEAFMGSYVPAVKAFHQDNATQININAKLSWVKGAIIAADGKYKPGQISVVEEVFAPLGGAINAVPPPNQIAVAITTVTAQLRGYARAGRFYLPLPAMAIDSIEGLISVAAAETLKGSIKTFLESIADVAGVDVDTSPTPVVMSKHGSGTTNKIIGAKVGRALDTQRRRRRSLPENYRLVDIDTGVF